MSDVELITNVTNGIRAGWQKLLRETAKSLRRKEYCHDNKICRNLSTLLKTLSKMSTITWQEAGQKWP